MLHDAVPHDQGESVRGSIKSCRFVYSNDESDLGRKMCPNETMWGADLCIIHIDEAYATPSELTSVTHSS